MRAQQFWRTIVRWTDRSQFLTFLSILAGMGATISGTLLPEYRTTPKGPWFFRAFVACSIFALIYGAIRFVASIKRSRNQLEVSPGGILTGGGVGKRNLAIRHQTFVHLLTAVVVDTRMGEPRSAILHTVGFRLGRTYVKDFLLARRKRDEPVADRKAIFTDLLDHDRDSGWGAAKVKDCREGPADFCIALELDELVTDPDSRDAQSIQRDEFLIGYYCGMATELFFPTATDDQAYLNAKFEPDPAKALGMHLLSITRAPSLNMTVATSGANPPSDGQTASSMSRMSPSELQQ